MTRQNKTRIARAAWIVAAAGTFPFWPEHAGPRAFAFAQPAPMADLDGPHRVSGVTIRFTRENPGHPAPDSLLDTPVMLDETAGGWSAPEADGPGRPVRLRDFAAIPDFRLTDTGLAALAPALVQRLKDLGFVGVYVAPDASQFHVEDGRVVDTRAGGDTGLVLEVTTGVVTQVRTVGVGERVKPGENVDNPLHARIRERSPVQPFREGDPARRDLLRRDEIDDFTARLNRQPGRRVDAAVSAPGDQPGAVALDYMVTENRPWLFFGQLSNTGSASTDAFREHFGFIHNDLSNTDDILTLDYQTANFNDMHALFASYDRPFPGSERWRWNVHGSYYTYLASDLGLPDLTFEGEGWEAGAEAVWNFYQHRDVFVDLLAGATFEHVRVNNELAGEEGDSDFLIPRIALRLERHRDQSRTDALVGLSFNLADAAGTDEDLDSLGRTGAESDFSVLRGELTHAFYLDPFFQPDAAKAGGLTHELLLAFKGQTGLGHRLIPNEQMVAGGLYTVRGYPEAIVAGDNVLIGTVEYRFHVPRSVAPEVQPGTLFGQPFRWKPQYAYGPTDWDLVLKAFVDAARVTHTDRIDGVEADNTLLGAGIGAELSVTRRFSLRVDLGFALRELDDGSGGHSVDAGHTELEFVLTAIY